MLSCFRSSAFSKTSSALLRRRSPIPLMTGEPVAYMGTCPVKKLSLEPPDVAERTTHD